MQQLHIQVHVVLMTQGHDPVLMRTLQEAASSLSGLNAVHSPSSRPLLPEVVKLGSEDPSLQQQPVRVLGGALTSNNQGVLAPQTAVCWCWSSPTAVVQHGFEAALCNVS